jgi:hypothetical protein
MIRTGLFALAALAGLGAASPALADWDNIGSIDVSYGNDRDTASPDFGGPVERLRFTARGGDVQCRTIRAAYGNGQSSEVFAGSLRQGQARAVDMPGSARTVTRVTFTCHAVGRGGAKLQMEADVGRYQAQWRASPSWASMWSRTMHWQNSAPSNSADSWVQIGAVHFNGGTDTDGTAAGWAGRNITTIAFKPVNGDAVCLPASVRFGNGMTQSVSINGGQRLRAGTAYKIDLPGNKADVSSVAMRCHPVGQGSVTINILGNK